MKKRPFSAGFIHDGIPHAHSCDCHLCAESRAQALKELWKQNGSIAEPKVGATVFVRSHFRRQHNHLNKMPHTRDVMAKTLLMIRRLMKKA